MPIPEGVTLLHVEYDVAPANALDAEQARRTWSSFPSPGNKADEPFSLLFKGLFLQEVQDFFKKIREDFGPKAHGSSFRIKGRWSEVRVLQNEPRVIRDGGNA